MRFCSLLLTGSLFAALSSPVLADEPGKDAAAPNSNITDSAADLLGDVVDGASSFLKVLVGPPLGPQPQLNLPGSVAQPEPVAVRPSAPAAAPAVAMPQPQEPPPAIAPAPGPAAPVIPPAVASPPAPIPPAPIPPAPSPMPAQVVVRHPFAKPTPAIPLPPPPAEPACRTRAAATATLEQAARLPRCGS